MACPFFLPVSPLAGYPSERWPLGELYAGECASDRGASIPVPVLRGCCNTGYARQTCARAALSTSDAVRFLIKASHLSEVEVAWSVERNHHPIAVGATRVSGSRGAWETPLDRQIGAFAAAFLRHGKPPAGPV